MARQGEVGGLEMSAAFRASFPLTVRVRKLVIDQPTLADAVRVLNAIWRDTTVHPDVEEIVLRKGARWR